MSTGAPTPDSEGLEIGPRPPAAAPLRGRPPDSEGLEIVVLGSFNPAILHPEWFLRQKLVTETEADQAKVRAVSSEVSELELCGLRLLCLLDRFSLITVNVSNAPRMQDLLNQIFCLLPHVPVTACGINPSAHYAVGTMDYWHKVGHTLAPKGLIWDELLDRPGMRSLTIQAQRAGEFPGEINVAVEPSALIIPGIFIGANYHYALPPAAIHDGATKALLRFLKAEWNPACEMVHRVADQIFKKIKPDNG